MDINPASEASKATRHSGGLDWSHLVMEALPEAFIACDLRGNIQYQNAAARQLSALQDVFPAESMSGEFPASDDVRRISVLEFIAQNLTEMLQQHAWVRRETILCDGRLQPFEIQACPIRDSHSVVQGIAIRMNLVKHSEQAFRTLLYYATHDELTGLLNRRAFMRRLERLRHSPTDGAAHAVFFMDLDNFKRVNDTCGHPAGDAVLKQLAALLRSKLRTRDSLARLGGDEFALLMEHCPVNEAFRVARMLSRAVEKYAFTWREREFHLRISIGVTTVSEPHLNVDTVLAQVDHACYEAKKRGAAAITDVFFHKDGLSPVAESRRRDAI